MWQISTVDTSDTQHEANRTTLAFAQGSSDPCIGYTDGGVVKYACLVDGEWNCTVVDAGPNIQDASLAFQRKKPWSPAITYRRWLRSDPVVENATDVTLGFPPGSSDPCFVYSNECNLKFANWNVDTWEFMTVDSVPAGCDEAVKYYHCYVGADNSIGFDTKGTPYVAYAAYYPPGAPGSLFPPRVYYKVAHLEQSTNWEITPVISAPAAEIPRGVDCSLAFMPGSKFSEPCISYRDHPGNRLMWAWYGLDFETGQIRYLRETVAVADPPGWKQVGLSSSLAFPPGSTFSEPCISYTDWNTETLNYATRTDGTWHAEVVDTGEGGYGVFQDVCLKFDSTGAPAISYHDTINKTLKYAYLKQTPQPLGDQLRPSIRAKR